MRNKLRNDLTQTNRFDADYVEVIIAMPIGIQGDEW